MKKSILLFSVLLLSHQYALADTPPARTINSETYDASANPIGSSVDSAIRGLNVHITNPNPNPTVVISGVPVVSISPIPSASPIPVHETSPVSNYAIESGGNLASILAKLAQIFGVQTDGTQKVQVVSLPSPVPVSAASLPLPAGAATSALQSSTITALGSPFQAGGSIGNTSFGISGTLPAFTSTPTFNLGTLNGAATSALQTTGNSSLSSIDGKLPATLGQKLMASSLACVLPSDQSAIPVSESGTWNITNVSGTISLPTGAATSANQTTANTSLATIATNTGKTPINTTASLVQSLVVGNGAAVTFSAPANTVAVSIEASSSNTQNLRCAAGTTATTTLGMRLEPGRSIDNLRTSATVTCIAEAGSNQEVDLTWVSQ